MKQGLMVRTSRGWNISNATIDGWLAVRNSCRAILLMTGGPLTDPGLTTWATRCADIASRYNAPDIFAMELLNEPAYDVTSCQAQARAANTIANAVAAVTKNKPESQRIKVMGMAWDGQASMTGAPVGAFLDIINGNPNLDYVSFHPYHQGTKPEIASPGATGAINTYFPAIIDFFIQHGWTNGFFCSEYGLSTSNAHPINFCTEKHQAQWYVRQDIMMHAHGGNYFHGGIQYQMFGDGEPVDDAGWGLLRSANDVADNGTKPGVGTPKPLYYAYQAFLNIYDGGLTSSTPISVPGSTATTPYVYRYNKTNGRYGFVFWTCPEGQVTNYTLTGLPAQVRKTLLDGTQSFVSTTNGQLTLPASNDVTYVDVVW